MAISKKQALWSIGAIVVLVVAGFFIWKQTSKPKINTTSTSDQAVLEPDKETAKDMAASAALQGNFLAGVLKASDNAKNGNLMLVGATSTVYLSTSRDYSQLLGKNVKVYYDGTPEDFRLGDILEN